MKGRQQMLKINCTKIVLTSFLKAEIIIMGKFTT